MAYSHGWNICCNAQSNAANAVNLEQSIDPSTGTEKHWLCLLQESEQHIKQQQLS